MSQFGGALVRSTGIVAAALTVLALLWGFLFSSRETGTRMRPAWWLDLHNWLGGLALAFTGAHVFISWIDSPSAIGVRQIFVPSPSGAGWAIPWGVIAAYLLAISVFTTWPRRLANRRWWRVLHLGSVVATGLALLHGYQSGSDAGSRWFQGGLIVLASVSTYGLGLRVFGAIERRSVK